MDCKTAQRMVTPYIKRELEDRELEEFIDHIKECKECHEELEIYFTIHFALQKLDEEKDVSYNIQKMLQDDLRASERRVNRRKVARIWSWTLMMLAEFVLVLVLLTQYQGMAAQDMRKTVLFELLYGEPETKESPESPVDFNQESNEEWEREAKKRKKTITEGGTSAQKEPKGQKKDDGE